MINDKEAVILQKRDNSCPIYLFSVSVIIERISMTFETGECTLNVFRGNESNDFTAVKLNLNFVILC
jgi:hypothetical protein